MRHVTHATPQSIRFPSVYKKKSVYKKILCVTCLIYPMVDAVPCVTYTGGLELYARHD